MKRLSFKCLIMLIVFIIVIALSIIINATESNIEVEDPAYTYDYVKANHDDKAYPSFGIDNAGLETGEKHRYVYTAYEAYNNNTPFDNPTYDRIKGSNDLYFALQTLHANRNIRCVQKGIEASGSYKICSYATDRTASEYIQGFAYLNSYDDNYSQTAWNPTSEGIFITNESSEKYGNNAWVQIALWRYLGLDNDEPTAYNNFLGEIGLDDSQGIDSNYMDCHGNVIPNNENAKKLYNRTLQFIEYRKYCKTSTVDVIDNANGSVTINYEYYNDYNFTRDIKLEIKDQNGNNIGNSPYEVNVDNLIGKKKGSITINIDDNVTKVKATLIVKNTAAKIEFLKISQESNQNLILIKKAELVDDNCPENAQINIDNKVDVSVTKNTMKNSTINASNDAERTFDRGSKIYFRITVKNNGPKPVYVKITDTFDKNYFEFESTLATVNSNYNFDKDHTLIREVTVGSKGEKEVLVCLKLKNDITINSENKYYNNVKISDFRLSQNGRILTNKQGNQVEDSDFVKCMKYKISTSKYLSKVNTTDYSSRKNNKTSTVYAEYGETFEYTIELTNTGLTDGTYGNIKYITISDVFNNESVTLESFSGTGWTKGANSTSGNKTTYKFIYNTTNGISPGNSTTLVLKFKYNTVLEDPIENKNEVTVTSVKNKNSVELKGKYLESGSNFTDSDKLTLKGYKFGINKEIISIRDKNLLNTGRTDYAETGDIVDYRITLSNNGSGAGYGSIKKFEIYDTFNASELSYYQHNSNVWNSKLGNAEKKKKNGLVLAPGQTVNLDISMRVKAESLSVKDIKNTATLTRVNNRNGVSVLDVANPISSTVTFKLDVYSVNTYKYINLSQSKNYTDTRKSLTGVERNNSPVEVEKGETLQYTIRFKNISTRNTIYLPILKDTFEDGIEYSTINSAKIGSVNIKDKIEVNKNNNIVTFKYNGNLGPKDEIIMKVEANITKSNMYLYNLENKIEVESVLNRNSVDVVAKNILNGKLSDKDYVRLKDLEISGKVWKDINKDGLMNNSEIGIENIPVTLHNITDNRLVTVNTDSSGNYSFGIVDKATNKDTNGNYTSNSQYKQYYIDFEYDGVKYQSTVYKSNGKENLNPDGSIKPNYKIDSNAAEFNSLRSDFNKALETVYYNKSIEGTDPNATGKASMNLTYTPTKDSAETHDNTHIARLNDNLRKIKAISFIDVTKTETDGIDYLWLHKPGQTGNAYSDYYTETSYLKYINLGLIERNVDINLSKDLYEIKTTVNGEQMTYKFDEHGNIRDANGNITSEKYITGGENNSNIPYSYEFYKSDYEYRYENYVTGIVKKYKENSELNAEVTYKITIANSNLNNNVYAVIRELTEYYSKDFKTMGTTTISKLENGILKNEVINNIEAWYYDDNTKVNLELSTTAKYTDINGNNLPTNYNKLYIKGLDNLKIEEFKSADKSVDIYIKYVVDKDSDGKLKIGEKDTLTEINAYSTYYTDGSVAGYIDNNSNPGDLKLSDLDNTAKYENDTYKTKIELKVSPVSIHDGGGELYEHERKIKGFVWDDARSRKKSTGDTAQFIGNGLYDLADNAHSNAKLNSRLGDVEKKDSFVKGVNVELVELVSIPLDSSGNIITNETTPSEIITVEETRKTAKTDESGKYELNEFIPGKYIVRFNYGDDKNEKTADNVIVFNGQDYKSTTFKTGKETGDNMNDIIKSLETANRSDARDDEMRRLEVISYSETMNNEKTEILQQKDSSVDLDTLIEKTKMFADTIEFNVRPEKLGNYQEYGINDDLSYAKLDSVSYTELFNHNLIPTYKYRFLLDNFDFGIQYRPEVKIELKKFITEVQAITSDGNTLVDAKFDLVREGGVGITGVTLNTNESKGIEMLQYLASEVNIDGTNTIKLGVTPGFEYINIDEEILQGLTIKISYVFSANNIGEVDRIGKNLNEIREVTHEKIYEPIYNIEEARSNSDSALDVDKKYYKYYTSSGTARNDLLKNYYKEINDLGTSDKIMVRTKNKTGNNYYGKFLGNLYYTGDIGDDVIAEIKVNKILDYIDNNLSFKGEENDGEDHYWTTITQDELFEQGLVTRDAFLDTSSGTLSSSVKQLLDYNNTVFNTRDKHNLIISMDDKNKNNNLSRFIKPKENGEIYVTANVVVSSETDTEKMSYFNVAEIIEYTTLTGRITNLNSTIGNTNIRNFDPYNPTPEILVGSHLNEIDSFFTERVTFAPPTGIELTRYYMNLWSYQIKIIITGIVAITIVFIGYKNRSKIKDLKPKKFYK